MPDATNLVLTLQPLAPQDAAKYALSVTNPFGRMISSPESLTVTMVSIGPVTLDLVRNRFAQITVAAPPGTRCRIEATDRLGEPTAWQTGKTLTVGSFSAFTWLDNPSADPTQRFYRAVVEP
jgi:hypothetical protein